jgi:rhodanese-related sulfurtransferase
MVKAKTMRKFPLRIGLAAATVLGAFLLARAEDVDINRAEDLLKEPKTWLLDVRTRREFDEGHIKGATLIPIQELKERWTELPKDAGTPILVYCTVGVRSLRAHRMLKKGGYQNVFNMKGGINAWTASGRNITPAAGRP